MRVRLPHRLTIGACERPAAAGWGDGVCVSQSRTFFTSSSYGVCGTSRARFCARPRAAQKVAPSLAHLSGAPKQPLDGGDGGCGAHKGALGAYHPTTSHRGWSAPSVRSAAVGHSEGASVPVPLDLILSQQFESNGAERIFGKSVTRLGPDSELWRPERHLQQARCGVLLLPLCGSWGAPARGDEQPIEAPRRQVEPV